MSFGIEVYILTQEERIIKRRFIDERYNQQLRVDIEDEVKPLEYDLPTEDFDALVISDYDKGFLTTKRIYELVEWFDGPIFIDSKKTNSTSRHMHISKSMMMSILNLMMN